MMEMVDATQLGARRSGSKVMHLLRRPAAGNASALPAAAGSEASGAAQHERDRDRSHLMNIGTVAERSGVSPKTIRYYESIGLIRPADRGPNGYRNYSLVDMRTLNFIKRARSLGFSVKEARELLNLWHDRSRTSAAVKALANRQMKTLDRKIEELMSMRKALADLVRRCRGDARPACPILDDFEQGQAPRHSPVSPVGPRPRSSSHEDKK